MLSIIIPTYEREGVLHQTLQHLSIATQKFDCEVIVVNDSNGYPLKVDSNLKNVKVVQNPNSGAASARNYGFQNSSGNIILFLDDDMIISEIVLERLLELANTQNKKLFLPNWIYPKALTKKLSRYKFGRFLIKINYTSLKGWINNMESWEDEKVKNQGVASYCLMMTRENYIEIKGYNEYFSFAGFEDHDLSSRLIQSGFQFYILTKLIIYHNEYDRVDLKSWLRRRRRNAHTQREAVEIGYENLKIDNLLLHFPYPKILIEITKILLFLCKTIPNLRAFDFVYFRVVQILIAINIYLGYNYDYSQQKN